MSSSEECFDTVSSTRIDIYRDAHHSEVVSENFCPSVYSLRLGILLMICEQKALKEICDLLYNNDVCRHALFSAFLTARTSSMQDISVFCMYV